MPHIGPLELVIIFAVILIIFGVGELPQVGGAIGQGLREFRKGQLGEEDKEEVRPKKRAATERRPRYSERWVFSILLIDRFQGKETCCSSCSSRNSNRHRCNRQNSC